MPQIFVKDTPTPTAIPVITVTYNESTYALQYFIAHDPNTLQLIPNFTKKSSTAEIIKEFDCMSGINGGFYDTEDRPLGGFSIRNSVLRRPVVNRLIDGYIWANNTDIFISVSAPSVDTQFSLQTGPLLFIDGRQTVIHIANDEFRRRSVALLTKQGDLLFMSIYDPDVVYQGPMLSELPDVVKRISDQYLLDVMYAINLDGGSASAFFSKDKTLQELTSVGSFFCLQ